VAMSCVVLAAARTCQTTGAVPIEAGHYLMVQIVSPAWPTSWRVSFR